jgi:hypothetical protein
VQLDTRPRHGQIECRELDAGAPLVHPSVGLLEVQQFDDERRRLLAGAAFLER